MADRLGKGQQNDFGSVVTRRAGTYQENGVVGIVFPVRITPGYPTHKKEMYMGLAYTFLEVHRAVEELQARLDALEANSRNAASSDQPFVGPPSQSKDSRALARPVSLAELKTFIQEEHASVDDFSTDAMYASGARDAYDTVLQHLTELDQGPVVQKPLEEPSVVKRAWHPNSENVQ